VAGTGQGQSRVVTAYNSTTKVATVDRAWDTTPDGTSQYAIGDTAAATLTAAGLDAVPIDGVNARQALALILAAEGGKLSGAGTTTITIRDAADTANRITATVDGAGNRTSITHNPPA
jgi:hypothetical protein